ncbi:MAG: NAD(P)H-hydrate dehydratase [Candidatus Omnitrophota bacterium]|jgi:NAD(P)H-hydrate epimerase
MVREHIEKIPVRREDSHKGDYGRVFVIAGSPGMTGAAFLSSEGALRTGSGLVTNGIPEGLNQIMEVKLTECMTLPLTETQRHTLGLAAKKEILEFCKKTDVVVLGPGLGRDPETRSLVRELVPEIECPVVLDADGINALEGDLDLAKKRKGRMVLTPHPGELSNLIGKEISEIQSMREDIAKSVAEVSGTVVCLKGHKTVVADPEGKAYVNDTGNSGMATGGMGDILTGMIASFIGQGVDDYSSTVLAVYLHGLAGDIAADKKGPFNMIATDVLEYLSEAFDKAGI